MGNFLSSLDLKSDPRHRRRMVYLTNSSGVKGRTKLWAFGYGDLALLFGVSQDVIRQWVKRGKFDPGSLISICKLWMSKN